MRQKISLTIVERAIIDVPGFDPRPLQNYLKYKILTTNLTYKPNCLRHCGFGL